MILACSGSMEPSRSALNVAGSRVAAEVGRVIRSAALVQVIRAANPISSAAPRANGPGSPLPAGCRLPYSAMAASSIQALHDDIRRPPVIISISSLSDRLPSPAPSPPAAAAARAWASPGPGAVPGGAPRGGGGGWSPWRAGFSVITSTLTRVRFEYKYIDHVFHDHLQAAEISSQIGLYRAERLRRARGPTPGCAGPGRLASVPDGTLDGPAEGLERARWRSGRASPATGNAHEAGELA